MELICTPDFRIEFDGKNITESLRPRLTSLSLVDEAGSHADKLTLQLDDRDGDSEIPKTGHQLSVYLGYRESGLEYMGLFSVGDIEFIGPPMSLNVSATSLDYASKFKEKRTAHYENLSLTDLAQQIAERHEAFQIVALPNTDVTYEHIGQENESDLHLLRRLVKMVGAEVSFKNGTIMIFEKGKEPRKDKRIELKPEDVSNYSITSSNRKDYSRVTAKWHNNDEAGEKSIEVGDDSGPLFVIKKPFQDEAHATAAASGKLYDLNRGKVSGGLTLTGRTDIFAGSIIALSGFRGGLDGDYTAKQVSHSMGRAGWKIDVRLEG